MNEELRIALLTDEQAEQELEAIGHEGLRAERLHNTTVEDAFGLGE